MGLFVPFSSKTDLWESPRDVFDAPDTEFGSTGDICALGKTRERNRTMQSKETHRLADGTAIEWTGTTLPDGTRCSGFTVNLWHGCTDLPPKI
jgi:hypothetical protein